MPEQNFGWALSQLNQGRKVLRKGWNGKEMWLHLQVPDANSKMKRPYIYMRTANGEFVPWVASQTDLLESDWELEHRW